MKLYGLRYEDTGLVWGEAPGLSAEPVTDVPDELIQSYRSARAAADKAEEAILQHLRESGQPEPTW